jgi:hypothetical protein
METKRKRLWYFGILAKATKLVKAIKFLKFGKMFLTFASMILSVLVYSFMLGPWFAFGFVMMLFIHEMGHIVALRVKGYNTPGPIFIPMLGAVIFAPKFRRRSICRIRWTTRRGGCSTSHVRLLVYDGTELGIVTTHQLHCNIP